MRENKQRTTRRTVEFFTACCGFRHPFKVILDGNFIHTAFATRVDDLVRQLKSVLHVKTAEPLRLYVTSCVLHELKTLSSDFAEAAQWAEENAKLLACGHERSPTAPDECIRSVIGDSNPEHYFVATQDSQLREALGNMQAGASLFITPNGVQLAQPTDRQQQLSKQSTEAAMVPSARELQSSALADLGKLQQGIRTSVRYRRKKAMGPNPLSVRTKGGGKPKKKRPGPALRKGQAVAADKKQSQKLEKAREKVKRRKAKQKQQQSKVSQQE